MWGMCYKKLQLCVLFYLCVPNEAQHHTTATFFNRQPSQSYLCVSRLREYNEFEERGACWFLMHVVISSLYVMYVSCRWGGGKRKTFDQNKWKRRKFPSLTGLNNYGLTSLFACLLDYFHACLGIVFYACTLYLNGNFCTFFIYSLWVSC